MFSNLDLWQFAKFNSFLSRYFKNTFSNYQWGWICKCLKANSNPNHTLLFIFFFSFFPFFYLVNHSFIFFAYFLFSLLDFSFWFLVGLYTLERLVLLIRVANIFPICISIFCLCLLCYYKGLGLGFFKSTISRYT